MNLKVDDARDLVFADPPETLDAPETLETLSLDDQIDYAEWSVTVAQAHLDALKAKKAELDAHYDAQYREHCEIENGKVVIESDNADQIIDREVAIKYLEQNPEAYTKVEPTDGSYAFGEIHLCTAEGQRIGIVSSADNSEPPADDAFDEMPF